MLYRLMSKIIVPCLWRYVQCAWLGCPRHARSTFPIWTFVKESVDRSRHHNSAITTSHLGAPPRPTNLISSFLNALHKFIDTCHSTIHLVLKKSTAKLVLFSAFYACETYPPSMQAQHATHHHHRRRRRQNTDSFGHTKTVLSMSDSEYTRLGLRAVRYANNTAYTFGTSC
jgi:hypothetical protein